MDRQIFAKIIGVAALAGTLLIPVLAFAAATTPAKAGCADSTIAPGIANLFRTQFCNANDLILFAIKTLLSVIAVLAAGMVIWGGYQYVLSNGDSEKATKGMKTVTNSLIGLTIAILAWTIVTVTINTVADRSQQTNTGTGPGQSQVTPSGNIETNTTPQDPVAQARLANAITVSADSNNGFVHFTLNPSLSDVNAVCPGNSNLPRVYVQMNINGDINTSVITDTKRLTVNGQEINTQLDTTVHMPIVPQGQTNAALYLKIGYVYDNGCVVVLQRVINTQYIYIGSQ